MTTDFQAAIAEVLLEHSTHERFIGCDGWNEKWEAVCGACGRLGDVESQEHQAAMLAPIILDAQAEALREAADALGKQKNGTDGFFAWWLTQRAAQMRAES